MKNILEKSVLVLDFISAQLGQFTTSAALINTVGKPSSYGPQTTFTVNHKPQAIFYVDFKGFVEVTLYDSTKWDVVWVGCHQMQRPIW